VHGDHTGAQENILRLPDLCFGVGIAIGISIKLPVGINADPDPEEIAILITAESKSVDPFMNQRVIT
jgi:hypothetical protein